MAASGFTPILLYASGTATNVPLAANLTSSASGAELAINYADGKLFYKDSGGVVQVLATKGGVGSSSNTQVLFNSSGLVAGSASLTWDGTNLLTNNITSAAATNLLLKSAGTTAVTIDTSQNVGVGATPSAWRSIFKAIDINARGSIASAGNDVGVFSNAYQNSAGNYIYKESSYASSYIQNPSGTGVHAWNIAASGTSGNTISFTQAMTLDSSGNLGLGVTPSAWASTFKAIQVGAYGVSWNTHGSLPIGYLNANCYYNGSNWIYTTSNPATQFVTQGQSGSFQWNTAASGTSGNAITFTQAMTLDASGNLGVGVTSPATKLDVSGVASTNGSTRFLAKFADTSAVALGNGGGILFRGVYTGTTLVDASGIQAYKENATDGNYSYAMTFATRVNGGDLTERMRIDSSGNLLVGTTSIFASGKECIAFNGSSNAGISLKETTAGAGTFANFVNNSGSIIGQINQNGASNVSYVTSSDYRLKENIAPMTGALQTISQLKPCTYTWKLDGSAGQGFIAHELQEVVPDAVCGEKDAVNEDGSIKPQGIDTSFLVATLTAAIKEQQALITQLTARITALEAK